MVDFDVPTLEHTPWPTPSRAIYGFVLYVISYVLFGSYIIWAIFPDSWLNSVGITYLPARHWVITFPFLMWLGVFLIAIIYSTMYWMALTDMEDIHTCKDLHSHYTEDLTDLDQPVGRIPTITDLNLHEISRMYQEKR